MLVLALCVVNIVVIDIIIVSITVHRRYFVTYFSSIISQILVMNLHRHDGQHAMPPSRQFSSLIMLSVCCAEFVKMMASKS